MLEETIITLKRLNCNGCIMRITNVLQALPSVEIRRTDTTTKTIQIRYSADQVSLESIKEALAEAHYPVVSSCTAHDAPHSRHA